MPISFIERSEQRNLEVYLTRRLSRSDFMEFIPVAERLLHDWGKMGLIVVMRDFVGCEAGAIWEDLKWDAKHYNDVERIALVGEKRWQAGMSKFCKPFSGAEIRYFDISDIDRARHWVNESALVMA